MKFLAFFTFLFSTTTLLAQTTPAPVHFVYGSDTSTPGIQVRQKTALYSNRGMESFTDPSRQSYTIMDPAYRSKFVDSFGNPIKMTWWMQGGSLYNAAENTNVPFPGTMTLYLMQKYHHQQVEALGDEMTFHYHTWEWSDVNGDGRFYWNQTDDFNKVKADFDFTIAQHFLEEGMFPVSFRSGWHYMDNAWQQYLNTLLPFSLHNNSPVKTNPQVEPIDNLIDWGHATLSFSPFRPSEDDYQVGGGSGGWNTRSRYFLRLNENDVRSIFEGARNGEPQIACVWSHLAENTFLSDLETSIALIERIAAEYPDVPFHYSTAIEAFQDVLQTNDTTPPNITAQSIEQGDSFFIEVTVDEPLFQPTPYVAIKTMYETFSHVEMTQTDEYTWRSTQSFALRDIAKWGVAATDSAGNLQTEFISLVPDDLYFDNEESGFSTKGSWTEVGNTLVNHHWGRTIHQANVSDDILARWQVESSEAGTQHLWIRFPFVEGGMPDAEITTVKGGQKFETHISTIIPNAWHYLGTFNFSKHELLQVEVQPGPTSNESHVFPADVVKLSGLTRTKQLLLSTPSMNSKTVALGTDVEQWLTLQNLGSETLRIHSIELSSAPISFEGSFPLDLPPFSITQVPLTLSSQIVGIIIDSLVVRSDDPVHPELKLPFRAEYRDYFVTVDNDSPEGYTESGDWRTSSTQIYGSSSRYAFISTGNDAEARVSSTIDRSGFFDVSYIVPATSNGADRADYLLTRNGTPLFTREMNQNEGSGSWNSLELVQASPGDNLELTLRPTDRNQSNKVLRADAFRFSYVGPYTNEIILDNDSEFYSEIGTWNTSVSTSYGESSRFAWFGENASAMYTWVSQQSSLHQLSLLLPQTVNASEKALYSILINGVFVDALEINQNKESGDWRPIASWPFQKGDTISVVLTNAAEVSNNQVLRADAIKWTFGSEVATSTESPIVEYSFELQQNYPNPFNPQTVIPYSISREGMVRIDLFDLLGRRVQTLVESRQTPGKYTVTLNAKDLPSGMYFYRLQSQEGTLSKKLVLVK